MIALHLPQPRNPLHFYRHLLREASYLPPATRPYITSRIRARFYKYRRDAAPKTRLREANHWLRFLRAANAGDMTRMRKLLLLSFGRTGARRRELMVSLREPDPPSDSAHLLERLQQAAAPQDWLARWNTQKLLAFAQSQSHQSFRDSPRPGIKSKKLDPAKEIPDVNIWLRPLPKKLARSKLRKWYKNLAHRVVPPINKGEWELLRDLAGGEAGKQWEMPRRRTIVGSGGGATQSGKWDWEDYLTRPVRAVERQQSKTFKALSGGLAAKSTPESPAADIHSYTPRFWRRLYTDIWRLSAVMEQKDGATGKWDIKWGQPQFKVTPSSRLHHEFFEGVDDRGAITAGSQMRKIPKTT